MKVIAVTGGIGSGKSLVVSVFKDLGADVCSADEVSHKIMLRGGSAYAAVLEYFGDEILNKDLEIDRRKLGDIVFSDNEKLEMLNSITHCQIYSAIKAYIEASTAEVVCLEIPLLFSKECPLKLDLTIAVSADKEIRIKRVIERDSCTREQAEAKIKNQLPDSIICEKADYIILNNGNINEVTAQVEEVYKSLL